MPFSEKDHVTFQVNSTQPLCWETTKKNKRKNICAVERIMVTWKVHNMSHCMWWTSSWEVYFTFFYSNTWTNVNLHNMIYIPCTLFIKPFPWYHFKGLSRERKTVARDIRVICSVSKLKNLTALEFWLKSNHFPRVFPAFRFLDRADSL